MSLLPLFSTSTKIVLESEFPKTLREFKLEFKIFGNGHGPEGFVIRTVEKDSQSEQFCKSVAASLIGDIPSLFLVGEKELVVVNRFFQATEFSEITPVTWRIEINRRQYSQLLEVQKRKCGTLVTPLIHPCSLAACEVRFYETQPSG